MTLVELFKKLNQKAIIFADVENRILTGHAGFWSLVFGLV
jgi:hypothetical protein